MKITSGSAAGASCRYRGPEREDYIRDGGLRHGTVPDGWESVEILVGPKGDYTYYRLEPADEGNRVGYGPFSAEGRFRVVTRINNPRKASEAWRTVKDPL